MKILATALILTVIASPAFAGKEKCEDVDIIVKNNSDRDIKVVDIRYWDTTIGTNGDWRNENAVTGRTAGQNGGSTSYTRNLEEVKNDPGMKVQVEFKESVLGKWKDAQWSSSSPVKKCVKGAEYTVTIGAATTTN
jgi:hypothetical protein